MKKYFTLLFALLLAVPALSMDIDMQDQLLREFLWEEFTLKPKEERTKVGLSLSAGGTRAFAHIGVITVLKDANTPIDMLTGTSMGSVVGSAYAAGIPVEDVWAMGETMTLQNVTTDLSFTGLFRLIFGSKLPTSQKFEEFLEDKLGNKTFEDLVIPFACPAMDIKTGEKIMFTSGPVALAVRASMNLPGVFEPVEYRQRQLVDGGVVDYLPIDAVRDLGAEYVIASLPLQDYSGVVPKTIAAYLLRIGDIRGAILTEESLAKADFAVRTKAANIPVLEFDMLSVAGELGVREMYKNLPALQEDLILFNMRQYEE
ncbi:NTE family protein [Elusimicrobium simillimum]|uniref:patatin-like phospholipase family protein n=1 Tax=Elusimicrobium simillimum TaxID=3143438 RepID=UPI003C702B82